MPSLNARSRSIPPITDAPQYNTPPSPPTSPADTRAHARGYVIKTLAERRYNRYHIDLNIVYVNRNRQVDMRDPFNTYAREAGRFVATL